MADPRKILVVDDTPTMRLIVSGMLEDLGFTQIFHAEDAESAFRMVQDVQGEKFSLVLLDWNMSGQSGIELLRMIRRSDPTGALPLVMMTSNNDPRQIQEAKMAGVSSYLVKPFGSIDLLARMEEAWKLHSHLTPTLDKPSGET